MSEVKRFYAPGLDGLWRDQEGAPRDLIPLVLASDYDAERLRADHLAARLAEWVGENDALRAKVERLCAERDQLDRIARHLVRAYIIDDQAYDPEKATNARLASYKERFK